MPSRLLAIVLAAGLSQAAPAAAEDFQTITDETSFVSLIEGRALTMLGIRLSVLPSGQIEGSAFGRAVTGAWQWADGFFCRDLFWGERDLGPNCQMVKTDGRALRFISDRGQGQYADLRLD